MDGGHFAGDVTTRKILQNDYKWPLSYFDCITYIRECDVCQRVGKPIDFYAMPLMPI